mgnify:CR=1 FL=1
MTTTRYTQPTVTYIRERDEFRVSFLCGGSRSTVGTCDVGGGFAAISPAFSDAAPDAIRAVNTWLRDRIA